MRLIQVVLVVGALSSLLAYLIYFRSALRDRLIALVLFSAAVGAIVIPEATTVVANVLGVGRGADLLTYILATGSVFAAILLYTKIHNTERTVTELVRSMAIMDAEVPRESEAEEDDHRAAKRAA